MESIRNLPWISALDDVANSGKDWRRKCQVKFSCEHKGRATQFCIQCTFVRYIGEGAFMVCSSKDCLRKHCETIGSHSNNQKRSKLFIQRAALLETRTATKTAKRKFLEGPDVTVIKDACALTQRAAKKQATAAIRYLVHQNSQTLA